MTNYRMGVPIPEPKQAQNKELYTTVAQMPVGACVDVPYTRSPIASNLSRCFGYKFTQRRVGDMLRLWRVE
jgi:hypothetical protein